VPESLLFDVFSDIKGQGGKHRSYITLEDFAEACRKYNPETLTTQRSFFENEDLLHEFVFRNMCETITRRESATGDLLS